MKDCNDDGREPGEKGAGKKLIRCVVVSRTKVRAGESISVIVRTNPGRDGAIPAVRIAGAAGPQQFAQFSGPPGKRTLTVSAVGAGNVVDTHQIDIEVLEADVCSPAPILEVRGDPRQEAIAI